MNKIIAMTSLAAAAFFAGCASTPEPTDPLPPDSAASSGSEDGLSGSGVDRRSWQEGEITGSTDSTAADRDAASQRPMETLIYFEFDSAVLGDTALRIVDAHAAYLRNTTEARVRLGGHTDERGTREYNIALGERRAESVRRALLLRGVPRAQITVVSYGEEVPAATGSGERVWAQNRRVEFNYLR